MRWLKICLLFLIFSLMTLSVYANPTIKINDKNTGSIPTIRLGISDLFCRLTGCSMVGDIDMGNNSIINANWINVTHIDVTNVTLSDYVPYVGATDDLKMGTHDIVATNMNFSYLFSNFVGGIDATGDPWWLGGTDFEIEQDLIVDGYIYGDGSQLQNVNVTDIWVNETGDTMTGNLSIDVAVGDAELLIESESNGNARMRLMEGSNLGFDFWYDGSGTNYFMIDSITSGIRTNRMRIERKLGNIDLLNNTNINGTLSMNTHNITNVDCLELNESFICDWADAGNVNSSVLSDTELTDNHIVRGGGTNKIQNSSVSIDDSGNILTYGRANIGNANWAVIGDDIMGIAGNFADDDGNIVTIADGTNALDVNGNVLFNDNLDVTGNITAERLSGNFYGDGSQLQNVNSTSGSTPINHTDVILNKLNVTTSFYAGSGLPVPIFTVDYNNEFAGFYQENPQVDMHIGTKAGITGTMLGDSDTQILNNIRSDGSNHLYIENGTASMYSQNATSGDHVWYTALSGVSGNTITFNEALKIQNDGNIHTSNNITSSHFHGDGSQLRNVNSSGVLLDTGDTGRGDYDFYSNITLVEGNLRVATGTTLLEGSTTVADNVDGGDVNITIGNTAIGGSEDETSTLFFQHNDDSAGKIVSAREGLYSLATRRNSSMGFYTARGGIDYLAMFINSLQNIGIGTVPSGGHRLTVNGTANFTETVYAHNFSSNSDFTVVNETGDAIFIANQSGTYGNHPACGTLGYNIRPGDPGAYDFTLADFTTDASRHDLDLSSIVPEGAKAVSIYVSASDNLLGYWAVFYPADNTNNVQKIAGRTKYANDYIDIQGTLATNSSRHIQYLFRSTTWSSINLVVNGWWC